MILNLDMGQEVKESARPNFRHLSRPCFKLAFTHTAFLKGQGQINLIQLKSTLKTAQGY